MAKRLAGWVAVAGLLLTLTMGARADNRVEKTPSTTKRTLGPGLIVERIHASIPPPVDVGDRIITLVRIDPQHYRFRLLTASQHGSRPAPEWVRKFKLTGVINASMFIGEDGRSTGLMIDGERAYQERVNSAFGAFLAWGPDDSSLAPVKMFGRGCPGFDLDEIRDGYRVVIQNYRMLDCQGDAIAWKDSKAYSVAAVGVDENGWMVFVHSRTPYRMTTFNRMLAASELGLVGVMYVEGGPEASLYVKTDAGEVSAIGSWETRFSGASNNHHWSIPNVIGFEPIDADAEPER